MALVYYNLSYLMQKKELLLKNDSLYAGFLEKATLRYDKGESNVLEKTTAENQRGQISLQLSQIQQDMDIVQLQFQLLLNTTTQFIPLEKKAMLTVSLSDNDSGFLASHAFMQYLKEQQQIAAAMTSVERSRLLPDLTLGYNIMSMKGTGADNKEYNSLPRFHSVQLGLSIPIFTGGQKAKINAARANELITAKDYEINLRSFESSYRTAFAQYRKFEEAIQYFEGTALKNAETITSTANKQFVNGEINYLEWVLLINQAISIRSDYIEAVKNRNISVAEVNFFINN